MTPQELNDLKEWFSERIHACVQSAIYMEVSTGIFKEAIEREVRRQRTSFADELEHEIATNLGYSIKPKGT